MTQTRTITDILALNSSDEDGTQLQAIARAAYWYGQAVGVKRLGTKYAAEIAKAREAAKVLRYHHQAESILRMIDGGQGYIYDGSFGEAEIGSWDFAI